MKNKPESSFRFYKTTNGVFASVVLEDENITMEIKLKKGYKTEKAAERATMKVATLNKVVRLMGFLVKA